MGFVELLLIGIGLAMDAFAVAVCKGLKMKRINYRHAVVIALFFGVFQGLMPFIGWLIGKQFEKYVVSIAPWIAFILLVIIGAKMIYEALNTEKGTTEKTDISIDYKELLLLAIATSIDALAVGITFSFFKVSIMSAVTIIAAATFIISFAGVVIGNFFGSKYKSRAEIFGGIILIFIGIKMLF